MFHNPNTKLEGENIIKLLKKLQHRGQDSSGIGYYCNDSIKTVKALGKVENLEKEFLKSNVERIKRIKHIFIGHTRYATSNKSENKPNAAYPITGDFKEFPFAFVFNGNIPETECDAELIVNAMA